jgi:tetratricopeptide (TPR) repeat protein
MVPRTPEQLFEYGRKQIGEGRRKYARSLFRKALKEGERSLDPSVKADLLISLGRVDRDLGFLEDARVHYAMAAEVIRTLALPLSLAHTLRHAADLLREQKKLGEAESTYAEVLTLYRAHPEYRPLDLGNALRGYALLKSASGDNAAALAMWREAGALYEVVGVQAGIDESRARIGELAQLIS